MRVLLWASAGLLWTTPLFAQAGGELQLQIPVQWTAPVSETATRQERVAADASFDYTFGHERVRLFYDMTLDTFGTPDPLRTWLHNAGVTGVVGTTRRAFELGGAAFWRANEGTWADAGFRGVNLTASGRAAPNEALNVSATYALYVRSFSDQSALDQVEHLGSWRALANLPTRTTILAVLSAGRKSYATQEIATIPQEVTSLGQPDPAGRGWRRSAFVPIQLHTIDASAARTQWSWAVRLAQSLDDRTGIWVQREERRTQGGLPPAIVWTPPMFYDDGVYDDPYVIDARTWRAGAKHVFARGHTIAGSLGYSDRTYAGLSRVDALTRATVDVAVPVPAGQHLGLDLVLGYHYFRNRSSEVSEGYRAHQVTAGLRVSFD